MRIIGMCRHTESEDRYSQGSRVTIWGMSLNVFLSVFKIAAGVLCRSQAVIADGIHSLSDLVSDTAVLMGLRLSSKPSDETHHYGHGKLESIFTLAVGLFLLAAAFGIGYEAMTCIIDYCYVPPAVLPIVAAAVSVVVKEALYHWTKRVGRRIKSPSMVANAWHHRSDAMTSLGVVAGLGVAYVHPSLAILDVVMALVVGGFVLRIALKICYESLLELSDSAPDAETVESIKDLILSVRGVRSLHKCRARRVQGDILVDVHIQVSGDLTVVEGHEISKEVRDRVIETVESVTDVLVHLEPIAGDSNDRAD